MASILAVTRRRRPGHRSEMPFFVGTAELGLRINQSLYLNTFFEGGNVWNKPREFDPTRLSGARGSESPL